MVFQNNILAGASEASKSTTFSVNYSCRFNDDDSPQLVFQPSGAGDSDKIFSFSFWIKRANIVTASTYATLWSSNTSEYLRFDPTHPLALVLFQAKSKITTALFRDPTAWMNIVIAIDTTQAVAGNRSKIWINGILQTSFSTDQDATLNQTFSKLNASGEPIYLFRHKTDIRHFEGYAAQCVGVDGVIAATDVGEFDDNGVWRPIDVSGLTFGTNGWLLDFADSSDLGKDVSGNGNDFTSSGLDAADQMPDTPTKNFSTLNSVQEVWGAAVTLSDGNLHGAGTAATVWNNNTGTIAVSSGKWIFASDPNAITQGNGDLFVSNVTGKNTRTANPQGAANCWAFTWDSTSSVYTYNQTVSTNRTPSPVLVAGDYQLCALDVDNLAIWFGIYDLSAGTTVWADNSSGWTGDPTDGGTTKSGTLVTSGGDYFYMGASFFTGRSGEVDFGQGALLSNVTIPTGFNLVNTANLAAPTILDGTANFQTTLYTGNGSTQNIDQTGNSTFQPDLVWLKNRSQADDHMVIDAARGVTKQINADGSDVEATDTDGLMAFSDETWIDASGETIIGNLTVAGGLSAAWDGDTVEGYLTCAAGDSPGTVGIDWGVGNTKTITRMISFGSSDYGYSSPGRTINIKLEGSTDNFSSSVVDLGGGTGDFSDATADQSAKVIIPTSTTAYRYHRFYATSSVGSINVAEIAFFEDTTTTRQGFTLGNGPSGYNDNAENFVAWQWLAGGGAGASNTVGSINTTTTTVNTEAGISIGTYTGTGSAATIGHGLGVAPKVVICKERANDVGSWWVYHGANTTAPETDYLLLDTNAATADLATIWNDTAPTSTVFSIGTYDDINGSSDTYVYYAFAEIEGFSKFSSYTGNGLASGPLVYTGFKPAYVMIKKTSAVGGWVIMDSQRSPFNEMDDQLLAEVTTAETTGSEEMDFLSNGFKIRTADSDVNTSAGTYVYVAFAEYPFGGDGVSPATAV